MNNVYRVSIDQHGTHETVITWKDTLCAINQQRDLDDMFQGLLRVPRHMSCQS